MTNDQTKAAIRNLGARVSVVDGEWRVTVGTSTYFTMDRKDALGTARAMVAHSKKEG